jgi:hypothetical protein
VEATTLNWLQRTNVPLELFATGGRVKFAGWPSKRDVSAAADRDCDGPNARFVERFTPSADGSRLDYVLTVTDQHSLIARVEMVRHWVWRPGEQVLPVDCKAQ